MYDIKLGKYRHYKGGLYEVIGLSKHSETLEDLVIYKSLGTNKFLWVRPIKMWDDIVDYDNKKVRRFTYISD